MNKILILFFITVFFSCKKQVQKDDNEYIKFSNIVFWKYDSSNTIGIYNNVNNGISNGFSQTYYKNGFLNREGYMINNESYGDWIEYDSLGNLKSEFDMIYKNNDSYCNSTKYYSDFTIDNSISFYLSQINFSYTKLDNGKYQYSSLIEYNYPNYTDSIVIKLIDYKKQKEDKIIYIGKDKSHDTFAITNIVIDKNTLLRSEFFKFHKELKETHMNEIVYRMVRVNRNDNDSIKYYYPLIK